MWPQFYAYEQCFDKSTIKPSCIQRLSTVGDGDRNEYQPQPYVTLYPSNFDPL